MNSEPMPEQLPEFHRSPGRAGWHAGEFPGGASKSFAVLDRGLLWTVLGVLSARLPGVVQGVIGSIKSNRSAGCDERDYSQSRIVWISPVPVYRLSVQSYKHL